MNNPSRASPVDQVARTLNALAGVVLCVMMMATVVDVFLRSAFDIPVFGTFDIVELTLVTMIFLALPETFRQEDHIVVDVVDHIAGRRVVYGLRVLGAVVAIIFLALMLRYGVSPAYDTYRFGEQTLDLGIPRYIHWIPILFGTAVAIVVALVVLKRDVGQIRQSMRER